MTFMQKGPRIIRPAHIPIGSLNMLLDSKEFGWWCQVDMRWIWQWVYGSVWCLTSYKTGRLSAKAQVATTECFQSYKCQPRKSYWETSADVCSIWRDRGDLNVCVESGTNGHRIVLCGTKNGNLNKTEALLCCETLRKEKYQKGLPF
jgi:hypothetical protein